MAQCGLQGSHIVDQGSEGCDRRRQEAVDSRIDQGLASAPPLASDTTPQIRSPNNYPWTPDGSTVACRRSCSREIISLPKSRLNNEAFNSTLPKMAAKMQPRSRNIVPKRVRRSSCCHFHRHPLLIKFQSTSNIPHESQQRFTMSLSRMQSMCLRA